jgi:hypothetical protein
VSPWLCHIIKDEDKIKPLEDYFKFPEELAPRGDFKTLKRLDKQSTKKIQRNKALYEEILKAFTQKNNIKETVITQSRGLETLEKEHLIRFSGLDNLNPEKTLRGLILEVAPLFKKLPMFAQNQIQQAIVNITGKSLFGILKNDPRLLEVYTDELLQIFYEVFNGLFQQLDSAKVVDLENISQKLLESKDPAKIKKLLNQATRHLNVEFKASSKEKVIAELKVMAALLNDAGFHKIKDSFDSMILIRKGEFSFKLWTRDFNDLVSAEMTGDCTSPGDSGFNFWTVPAWLSNRGFNMLYLYGPDQKLIYKAGLLVTIDENKKPLLIIDSIEVGKETLKNYSKEKERQYLNLLITRTQKIAQNMHINPDHVYAVTASNTGQPIAGLGSIVKVNHQPLAGSQNLFFQDKVRALFYFQSLWDVARYEESAYECEKMIRNYIDEKKPEYEKLMQLVENQAFAETVDFLRKNIVNTDIVVLETGINFLFHSTMKDFTVATAHLLSFAAQDKKSILDMDFASFHQINYFEMPAPNKPSYLVINKHAATDYDLNFQH